MATPIKSIVRRVDRCYLVAHGNKSDRHMAWRCFLECGHIQDGVEVAAGSEPTVATCYTCMQLPAAAGEN